MDRRLIIAFISIETAIYACFLILDLSDGNETTVAALKYASILICVAVAAIACIGKRSKSQILAAGLALTALIFTAVSDYFLLFADDITPGVLTFCVVQTVYLMVITGAGPKKILCILGIRILMTAACVICLHGLFPDELLLLASVSFYAISFLGNIIHLTADIILRKDSKVCLFGRSVMFFTGMILFLLCDINVLLYNLGEYINIDSAGFNNAAEVAPYLIWLFYLPSQVLIVLSNLEYGKTERK